MKMIKYDTIGFGFDELKKEYGKVRNERKRERQNEINKMKKTKEKNYNVRCRI